MGKSFQGQNIQKVDIVVQWLICPFQDRLPDEQTATQMIEKLGIARQTFYDWIKSDYVRSEIDRLTKADRGNRKTQVLNALYSKAITGDVPAIKVYLEKIEDMNEVIKLEGKQDIEVTLKDIIKAESDDTSEDK